jgi:hypothetical protein
MLPFDHRPELPMTTSVRLHRRTCVFERQDVGIYDSYVGAELCEVVGGQIQQRRGLGARTTHNQGLNMSRVMWSST